MMTIVVPEVWMRSFLSLQRPRRVSDVHGASSKVRQSSGPGMIWNFSSSAMQWQWHESDLLYTVVVRVWHTPKVTLPLHSHSHTCTVTGEGEEISLVLGVYVCLCACQLNCSTSSEIAKEAGKSGVPPPQQLGSIPFRFPGKDIGEWKRVLISLRDNVVIIVAAERILFLSTAFHPRFLVQWSVKIRGTISLSLSLSGTHSHNHTMERREEKKGWKLKTKGGQKWNSSSFISDHTLSFRLPHPVGRPNPARSSPRLLRPSSAGQWASLLRLAGRWWLVTSHSLTCSMTEAVELESTPGGTSPVRLHSRSSSHVSAISQLSLGGCRTSTASACCNVSSTTEVSVVRLKSTQAWMEFKLGVSGALQRRFERWFAHAGTHTEQGEKSENWKRGRGEGALVLSGLFRVTDLYTIFHLWN